MTDEKKFTGWKRTYIGLLNVATVISIILGCIIHIGGFIGGDIVKSLFGTGRNAGAEGSATDFEEAVGAFEDMEGELAMGSLIIRYGDDYTVSYRNYPENEVPTWKVSGGTLKIEQKTKKKWKPGSLKSAYSGAEVVITIPENAKMDIDFLQMNMGMLTIEKGMIFGDVHLVANMGSIELAKCKAEELDLDAAMGSITIEDGTFEKAKINASMGSITLKDVTFEDADLNADMGSIEVSGTFNELEATCGMGGIDVANRNKDARLDLKADMGGVSYNGEAVGKSYKR